MRKQIHIYLGLTLIFVFLLNSTALAGSVTDSQTSQSINKAIGYLHAIQNKDGGFPAQAGDQSNPGTSCWAVMALAAAGEDITGKAW
ncbi:MAG TPA: hypothetical protein VHQ70_02485, partial [Syntrophomonadaceae bacterium]|nr:hypothetical protein [Syntrophomonadaceae bacterium]